MKQVVCDWLIGCLLASPVASPAELQYRAIVYQLDQQRNERALIEILATQALAVEQPGDHVRYKLAEVSAAYAAGLRSIAQDAAAILDAEQLGPQDRIRVALLRARDHQQHREWTALEREVAQIDRVRGELGPQAPLPAEIGAEIAFMHAELATASGDVDRAERIIRDDIPARDSLRAFALFNLGVALQASGSTTRAEQAFATLTSMPVYTEVALDLKQRAQIALSMIKQQRTETASAESILRAAPAQGRYHQQALASYASLAMEHGDFATASGVWSTLLQESLWSSAGKVAQVAYPLSLESTAGPEVALGEYRRAEANFEHRLRDLTTLVARTEDPSWDAQLLRGLANLADAAPPLDPIVQEWRDRLGHDDWLVWLHADQTQWLLQQWRDLDGMGTWLASAPPEKSGAADFAARARALSARVVRLTDDRQSRLMTALGDIVKSEVQMAQRQLGLIRVGIARTTDAIAENQPAIGEP